MDFQKPELKSSPEIKAWFISRLFLCWLFPLLKKGSKRSLELEDVYHTLPEDSSEKFGKLLEKKWNEETHLANSSNRPPKLWKAIGRLIFKVYGLIGLGYTFDELILRTIQPLALRCFIKTFNVKTTSEKEYLDLRRDQYIYATVLISVTFMDSLLFHKLIGQIIYLGMQMKLGVSSLTYQKMLKVRSTSSENRNVGKLCNLLSTDVSHLDSHLINLHYLYIAPVQLLICTYLLWMELGVFASFTGLAVILFVSPFTILLGKFAMHFRTQIGKRTDERGRFVNEVVTGIRVIKMYAWEKPFASLITRLRTIEIEFIRKSLYMRGIHLSVKVISLKLIPFCGLIVYSVGMGELLTADKAFFSVMIYSTMLQAVASSQPNALQDLGELLASLNRIEQFLLSSDYDSSSNIKSVKEEKVYHFAEKDALTYDNVNETKEVSMEAKIEMKNFSACWISEKETLKNLNINLYENNLVIVIGHVGSGKSSFLNAILGELQIFQNEKDDTIPSYCKVQGRLSYASQEAWIFPASIRHNILFGLPMDEERYRAILKSCCLEEDLEHFPEGDMTLVGERGVLLSGGQKARVNLARSLYQKVNIYLLDDPLSAVDTKVGQRLFQNCIKDYLVRTLRILATHDMKYLPMADHIIVLNRDGSIWFQGTYKELKESTIEFGDLISEQRHVQNDSENKDLIDITENTNSTPTEISFKSNSEKMEKEESKQVGSVGIGTYFRYFQAGGSYSFMVLLLVAFFAKQILQNLADLWLSQWTNAVAAIATKNGSSSLANLTDQFLDAEYLEKKQNFYAYMYCGIMLGFIVSTISRSILFFKYCMNISVNLHNNMFHSIIRAPVKFYDENPSGRVMNRFTKDLNHIDEKLPVTFYTFVNILFNLFGILAINISANYYAVLPSAVFLVGLWKLRGFFLKSSRDLKRIEAVAKSPLFTHVTMTVQGLTTIRALKAEKRMMGQYDKIQDTHNSVYYLSFMTNRWFAIWVEMMVVIYLGVVTFGFLLLTTSFESGNVGVALYAILSLAGSLQWGIRQSAETENYMTSVERIFEYSKLKPEAPLETEEDLHVTKNWPKEGQIMFKNVSLAYDDQHKNKVLKNISFSIHSNEKIGIVGRTGAGKSSLLAALFRLIEPCNGQILIDGVLTDKIGLSILRSRISIIPQDPVLFSGTIRYNLDPFSEFQDYQLWSVLREVGLHQQVQNLDCPVSDGGSNFSVGERQLICLARAILRKNKILVMDEATANVDPATDQFVQKTIRYKFSDCTILTIAHRLQTIMDSDRIMVLDAGEIKEFDHPQTLLGNEHGSFYKLVHYSTKPT